MKKKPKPARRKVDINIDPADEGNAAGYDCGHIFEGWIIARNGAAVQRNARRCPSKTGQAMKTLVALVGTKFRGPDMVKLLASLPQGEPLTLIREPDNAYDRNAVQVWARGSHIGYVKGNQNRDLAMAMDAVMRDRPDATGFLGKLAIDGGKQPMVEIDQ